MSRIALSAVLLVSLCSNAAAQEQGKLLPKWQEGFLDIHHINTGHGDAAFYIFPDGTTMLLDAGEMDPTSERINSARNAKPHPNGTKRAHEWIVDYIKRFHPQTVNTFIDYAVITHFHDDHFGSYYKGAKKASNAEYYLSGITGVGYHIKFKKILDRGYPDYNYPLAWKSDSIRTIMLKDTESASDYLAIANYWSFIDYQKLNNGMVAERFKAGSNQQIVPNHKPDKYKSFRVQNIKANGTIWTGKGSETVEYFPPLSSGIYVPGENQLSLAMRIDYGDFRFYTGGDCPGIADLGAPKWNDVETPMSVAIGEVDVAVMDHHGNRDAHNEFNVTVLRPRVWIQQTWSSDHPGHEVLRRVTSTFLYPGPRDLFATNMLEANKLVIGPSLERSYKSMDGHILVRVVDGGTKYYVIILNDENETNEILSVHGPYDSKTKKRKILAE
jgi:beta-lactamase superfamily II metal-dependent hydrolase